MHLQTGSSSALLCICKVKEQTYPGRAIIELLRYHSKWLNCQPNYFVDKVPSGKASPIRAVIYIIIIYVSILYGNKNIPTIFYGYTHIYNLKNSSAETKCSFISIWQSLWQLNGSSKFTCFMLLAF